MLGQSKTFSSLILSPVISTSTLPAYSGVNLRVTVVPKTDCKPTFTWPKEEVVLPDFNVIFPKVSPVEKIKGLPYKPNKMFPLISSKVEHSNSVPVFATKFNCSLALQVNSWPFIVNPYINKSSEVVVSVL